MIRYRIHLTPHGDDFHEVETFEDAIWKANAYLPQLIPQYLEAVNDQDETVMLYQFQLTVQPIPNVGQQEGE